MIYVHILCSNCPPHAATQTLATLEVFFTTLQLLYQCAGPGCPIPEQPGVVARRHPCRVLRDRYQLRPRLRRVRYDIV